MDSTNQTQIIQFLENIFNQTTSTTNEPITVHFDTRIVNQAEGINFTVIHKCNIENAEISHFTTIGSSNKKISVVNISHNEVRFSNGLLIDNNEIESESSIPRYNLE